MRYFILSVLISLITFSCMAKELYTYNKDNFNINDALFDLEKSVYSKEYTDDDFIIRIERLESTIFGTKYDGSAYKRIDQLRKAIAARVNKNEKISKSIIIDLLENRYFGSTFANESIENRLSRLEKTVLGRTVPGSIEYRFENLSQKVPLNISGISVTDSSKKKVSVKPYAAQRYSPLSTNFYVASQGDYIGNISKLKGNEVLRWKDLPIYVYISPNQDIFKIHAAQKAIQIWDNYIPLKMVNNQRDAQIVILWDNKGNNITEQALEKYNNSYEYKVLIHGKNSEGTNEKFLVHELGHSLGIWGHSNNKNDIMYNFEETKSDINQKSAGIDTNISIDSAPNRPSSRDINTLIRIYNLPSAIDDLQKSL